MVGKKGVKKGQCVQCLKKPVNPEFFPFCGPHCKNQDLGAWFREEYRIPADELPDEVPTDEGLEMLNNKTADDPIVFTQRANGGLVFH